MTSWYISDVRPYFLVLGQGASIRVSVGWRAGLGGELWTVSHLNVAEEKSVDFAPPSDFAPTLTERPRNQNYHFSDKHTNLEIDIEIEFDNFCLTWKLSHSVSKVLK